MKTSPKKVKDEIEQMIDYLESQTIDGVSIYTDWEGRKPNDPHSKKTLTRFSYILRRNSR